jgi:hypothetical protein
VANSLCTDLAGISSSSGSGTAAVQVTVEVHAASWDVRQYILSQQQQQGQLPESQPSSSTPGPKVFGPYAATLSKDKRSVTWVTQLQHQHEPQTYLQHLAGKPHRVVLQERVSAEGLMLALTAQLQADKLMQRGFSLLYGPDVPHSCIHLSLCH